MLLLAEIRWAIDLSEIHEDVASQRLLPVHYNMSGSAHGCEKYKRGARSEKQESRKQKPHGSGVQTTQRTLMHTGRGQSWQAFVSGAMERADV